MDRLPTTPRARQCHRANLTGADGPALRDERFARNFAGKDLKTLYTKVATTMPRSAPGSLGDDVYLDIVAHVLKENGFPAGAEELTTERFRESGSCPAGPNRRRLLAISRMSKWSAASLQGRTTPGS